MPSWVQDPVSGKLIPKEEYRAASRDKGLIIGDIEPFKSPIDGTLITSRSKLRDHNKRHGVTNVQDYGPEWFTRKAKERADNLNGKNNVKERIDAIKQSIYNLGGDV
jgi:hypothetical protein